MRYLQVFMLKFCNWFKNYSLVSYWFDSEIDIFSLCSMMILEVHTVIQSWTSCDSSSCLITVFPKHLVLSFLKRLTASTFLSQFVCFFCYFYLNLLISSLVFTSRFCWSEICYFYSFYMEIVSRNKYVRLNGHSARVWNQ